MLLHVPTLQRRRPDHHERALPQLHLPRLDAHVLPQGLPVRQAHRPGLPDRETARSVLPHHYMSRTYVSRPWVFFFAKLKEEVFTLYKK